MDQPVNRYLQGAIAAEKSFETQLRRFAGDTALPQASELLFVHADETREQYEMLTARLQTLGGSTSIWKNPLTDTFGSDALGAQSGHLEEERTARYLIVAFAIENAEVAMYEALRIAAGMAGDSMTVSIIERIQVQEQQAAEKVWRLIATAAERGVLASRRDGGSIQGIVTPYLEDAEAVERNLEAALSGFSNSGDQQDIRALMLAMSGKARRQLGRLSNRMEELGARFSGKSLLARLLTFEPTGAQLGHDDSEKNTQHLMIVYAAAAAQMAMYEVLQTAAKAAGDGETRKLAQQLQLEESEDHRLAWEKLPEAARASWRALLSTV